MADRLTDDARGASIAAIWESVDAATQRKIVAEHDAAHIDFAVQGAARLRAAQRAPEGDWTIWAILAGRGFGKTRAGAEWVHELAARAGAADCPGGASLEAARADHGGGGIGPVGAGAGGRRCDLCAEFAAGELGERFAGAAVFGRPSPTACAAASSISPGAMNSRIGRSLRTR
jgi:hypothetical protein